ncbi:hypothetical protein [Phascolarctobacterium sp.]
MNRQRKVIGTSFIIIFLFVAAMLTAMSVSYAKFQQSVLASTNSNSIAVLAQQHGETQAAVLRMTKYQDLKSQVKTKITDTDFFYETSVSAETNYSDKIKQRIVTINIYYKNEPTPRFSLPIAMLSKTNDASGCEIRTGTNSVSLQAVGSYKYLTVIASSKFSPSDSSWSGSATFTVSAAGTNLGTVSTSTYTQKAGSKGHYWGTTENVVNMHTFARTINAGDTVSASLTSSSRHSGSTVTVILSN